MQFPRYNMSNAANTLFFPTRYLLLSEKYVGSIPYLMELILKMVGIMWILPNNKEHVLLKKCIRECIADTSLVYGSNSSSIIWQEHRVGRWSRRELLQWNNSNWWSLILGLWFPEKHNASNWRRVQKIQSAHNISQHYTAFQLPKRCTYFNLQEAMEPIDSTTIS